MSECIHGPRHVRQPAQRAALITQAKTLDFTPYHGNLFQRGYDALARHYLEYDKYAWLGERLCKNYLRQLSKNSPQPADNHTIRQGYKVITRMLSYAPQAYSRFAAQTGQSPTVKGLVTVLEESHQTPDTFAAMTDFTVKTYETAFGINRDRARVEAPFLIHAEASDESPLFVPNPEIWQNGALPSPENKTGYWCPARGIFIANAWRQAVKTCAEDEFYFATDLAAITQAHHATETTSRLAVALEQ